MQKIHLEEPGEGYWENMFPLYGKAASTLKKLKKIKKNQKNCIHWQDYGLSLKMNVCL